jgi:hypothetical protein
LLFRIDRDLPWSDVALILDLTEPAVRKRFERLKEKICIEATLRGLLPT